MAKEKGHLMYIQPGAESSLADHRNNLLEHRAEPSEATGEFQKLTSSTSVLNMDGPNGKQVLWKDLEPGRRRSVDWIKEPARLGYTTGVGVDKKTTKEIRK